MTKETEKNKGGRPAFQPTAEQRKIVHSLASVGVTHPQIADVIGIGEVTLRKYFRAELDNAEMIANAKVAANLFKQATKDDFRAVGAAAFWMKTRAGWRETQDVNVKVTPYDKLPDDELQKLFEERINRVLEAPRRTGH